MEAMYPDRKSGIENIAKEEWSGNEYDECTEHVKASDGQRENEVQN